MSSESAAGEQKLLQVTDLEKHFSVRRGTIFGRHDILRAVDGVSLEVSAGETLAIVGESGCGKTTLGRTILRLYEPTSGSVKLGGVDLGGMSRRDLMQVRRRMQMIFQDPQASLDPRMTVASIIGEPLYLHGLMSRAERRQKVEALMQLVELDPRFAGRYPHEFSGGQRQRIGIARALALDPELVVCDEPISALDVSIQAQIVNLLMDLQDRLGLTYLFISHDMNIVRHVSNRVAVMYLGKIVELASREALFEEPLYPYTTALLSAVCVPDPNQKGDDIPVVEGDPPSPINPPQGCRFHTRCLFAQAICKEEIPPLREARTGHAVACHLVQDGQPPRTTRKALH